MVRRDHKKYRYVSHLADLDEAEIHLCICSLDLKFGNGICQKFAVCWITTLIYISIGTMQLAAIDIFLGLAFFAHIFVSCLMNVMNRMQSSDGTAALLNFLLGQNH